MRPQVKSITLLENGVGNICATQTTGAAGDMLINGTLATSGVATLSKTGKEAVAMIVTVTSAGDNSGISFSVTGTDADNRVITDTFVGGNTVPASTTLHFLSVTGISVNGAITGNVTVDWLRANGGVTSSIILNSNEDNFAVSFNADLRTEQNVLIVCAGDETAITYVITGEDSSGTTLVENLVGVNAATATSVKLFSKVTEIDTVGNSGTVTAGTVGDPNGYAQSQDPGASAALTLNGALVSGLVGIAATALTYTVDHSMSDPYNGTPTWMPTDDLTSLGVDADGNLRFPARMARLRVSAYTSGGVRLTAIQSR